MPQLVADALELYLAEIAAQSIIRQVDITGAVSASAHDRHKFPRSEIESFLSIAAATPKNSFQRLVAVAQLMNISGGVYPNFQELCASDALKNVNVQSHYSSKSRLLRVACLDEPMNLFYGSASGNVSGGAALDLHILEVADFGNAQIRSNVFDYLKPDGADPQGPRKMEHVAPDLSGHLQGSISVNGPSPKLTRSASAYSLQLHAIHQTRHAKTAFIQNTITGNVANLPVSISKTLFDDLKAVFLLGARDTASMAYQRDKQRLMSALDAIIADFRSITTAGERHYVDLVNDIDARNGLNSAILQRARATIFDAYIGWHKSRTTVANHLQKVRDRLNHAGTTDLFTVDAFGNSSVNAFSYLLGVSHDYWWQ